MDNKNIKKIILLILIPIILILVLCFIYWYFIKEDIPFAENDILLTRAIEVDDLFAIYAIELPKTKYQKDKINKITDKYVYEKHFDIHRYIYADEFSTTYEIKSRSDNALFVFEDLETGKRFIGYFEAVIYDTQNNKDLLLNKIFTTIYNIQSKDDIIKISKNNPRKRIEKDKITDIFEILKNMKLVDNEWENLRDLRNKEVTSIDIIIRTKHGYDIELQLYCDENKIIKHRGCYFICDSDEDFEKLITLLS